LPWLREDNKPFSARAEGWRMMTIWRMVLCLFGFHEYHACDGRVAQFNHPDMNIHIGDWAIVEICEFCSHKRVTFGKAL
jgi:hypothetical protein